jgi:hypothetical protein
MSRLQAHLVAGEHGCDEVETIYRDRVRLKQAVSLLLEAVMAS